MIDDPLDEIIKAKLAALDTTYPPHLPHPNALWRTLLAKRASQKTKKQKVVWSIAAAGLILAMAGYQFIASDKPNEAMIPGRTLSVKERNALEYIARVCAEKNISCSSPVVQELRTDLERSFARLEEIDQQLRFYGNDATLIRAKTRIENHQARVIKAIVQTL